MPCPICRNETSERYRPFCSRRCADVDLGRWLRGGYAVPTDIPATPDEAGEEVEKPGPRQD
ncbi:DNA gyrase inhibitor YacG [Sinisalibacter lacisalsi]|uniref:DNA gyrase inhibitor YacG n=1 Tax=Sinisalibacter lacisalsi TaxID=1526570 RepID=A0ABQ1QMY6_9RHOB|nr:DNA gyrase inhibitor YacG [Sinisalibacter lacisalsi]GGD35276.1 DNA gyrase inhibitor YacG [Sinisalibacter lacisalsi]